MELNIHNLIYEEVLKLLQSTTSEEINDKANKILFQYLNLTKIKTETWSKRDDIVELNIQKLRLSSKIESCIQLLENINEIAFNDKLNLSLNKSNYKQKCDEIKNFDNTLELRWSKTVLNTWSNIVLFLNTTNTSKAIQLLNTLLKNYLIFVYIVPKEILICHMKDIEKILSSIFESTSMHDDNEYLEVSLENLI